MSLEDKKEERVRLSSYGAGKAEFTGLTPAEVTMMESASNGTGWVTVSQNGRLVKSNKLTPPPPVTDEGMEPFWRKHQEAQTALKLDDFEPLPNWHEPSISIQHLCGYDYTPLRYKSEAEKLTRWGFHCLRSKRGTDGRFWEIWFLPGFWLAKEELKKVIDSTEGNLEKKTKAVINFLARRASFGSMDMSVQKLAMTID
jgi:hypothetical protein